MSSYEFWDELGKIFNAVVAYQEKNLEFNKRFISPWIRLGNVFEKQDRNKEAVEAYKSALEIDGTNPQNWFELGNIHFKMENYSEALTAFNRAIELDPAFGWAYNNLALTLATTGETQRAVALYQKSIDLLKEAKDKAIAWNRLGNAYRKLNEYQSALAAFHRADELDRDNGGFNDSLDEVTEGPTLVESAGEGTAGATKPVSVSPIEIIVAESRAAEAEAQPTGEQPVVEAKVEAEAEPAAEKPAVEAKAEAQATPITQEPAAEVKAEAKAEPTASEKAVEPQPAVKAPEGAAEAATEPAGAPTPMAPVEETVTVVVHDSTETFTETLPLVQASTEMIEASLTPAAEAEEPAEEPQTKDIITSQDVKPLDPSKKLEKLAAQDFEALENGLELTEPEAVPVPQEAIPMAADPAPNSLADQLLQAEPEVLDVAQHVAYEEYLKDTNEPLHALSEQQNAEQQAEEVETPGSPEPVAKLDESGELQIEMDTKNAHVWNELGNVYYNTGAYDDAIVAYSKAIELDRWFAWPYSNLALAYVQKRRFVEAILLYQRSIELFGGDKDKAISWNRLGNVYRRLNDYENAIAAYQRADALDPDNSTLSLQSRFSLLGNYAMEQKPAYVS